MGGDTDGASMIADDILVPKSRAILDGLGFDDRRCRLSSRFAMPTPAAADALAPILFSPRLKSADSV